MTTHFILEGCDRLSKSTVTAGLINRLGFRHVIHHGKPMITDAYRSLFQKPVPDAVLYKQYQAICFDGSLRLLNGDVSLIMDRAHLGEAVYAHRYRGYDGDYVFNLEKIHCSRGSQFHEKTVLVLLTTSDWSFIHDDGESFDFSKKEEEQADFIAAFGKSIIRRKLIVDVNNGNGAFKTRDEILDEILNGASNSSSASE